MSIEGKNPEDLDDSSEFQKPPEPHTKAGEHPRDEDSDIDKVEPNPIDQWVLYREHESGECEWCGSECYGNGIMYNPSYGQGDHRR